LVQTHRLRPGAPHYKYLNYLSLQLGGMGSTLATICLPSSGNCHQILTSVYSETMLHTRYKSITALTRDALITLEPEPAALAAQ
jgi:hypothetical protein